MTSSKANSETRRRSRSPGQCTAARFIYLQLHLLVVLVRHHRGIRAAHFAFRAGAGGLADFSRRAGGAFLVGVILRRKVLPPPGRMLPAARNRRASSACTGCVFSARSSWPTSRSASPGMATISFFTAFTEPLLDRRRIRPLEVALGLLVVVGHRAGRRIRARADRRTRRSRC